MVSKKTGGLRGRPRLNFMQDPDRFAIALAFAFKSVGSSENDAFLRACALAFGSEVSAAEVVPRRKRGRGMIPGGVMVTYERAAAKGGASGSLVGRATTLRQKAARARGNPTEMIWLLHTQGAFAMALQAAPAMERCADRILKLVQLVLEGKLAEDDMLLNLLSAELPDLFTNDQPQQ
ncbi:hypothetical protein ABID65_004997 [Bradyrhizobium sp. S3.9.2]|uniref:hypothetical protein n=1 Tax=unclassified Bradyrhizobium TaxID=2631580 RepID=UPI0033927908